MTSKLTGREIIQNRSKYISQEEYNSLTVGKNLYEGVIDLTDNKKKLYQKKKLITLKELDVNNRNNQKLNPKISVKDYKALDKEKQNLYTVGFGKAGENMFRLKEKKNNSPKNTGLNSRISMEDFKKIKNEDRKLYIPIFNDRSGNFYYKKK